MSEQDARLVINKKLEDSGWVITGPHKNVKTEELCDSGFADYLLLGRMSHMSGHRLPKPNAKKCQDMGYPTS
jgi:hypothetical protein